LTRETGALKAFMDSLKPKPPKPRNHPRPRTHRAAFR